MFCRSRKNAAKRVGKPAAEPAAKLVRRVLMGLCGVGASKKERHLLMGGCVSVEASNRDLFRN